MFSYELWEVSKNTFSCRAPRVAASVHSSWQNYYRISERNARKYFFDWSNSSAISKLLKKWLILISLPENQIHIIE